MLGAEDSLLVGYRFGICFKDQSSAPSIQIRFGIAIHVSVSGFSCAENEQNKADSNFKYIFIMVASRAKVAPFALCLLGGSAPQAPLPDLTICGCGVLLRQTKCNTAA